MYCFLLLLQEPFSGSMCIALLCRGILMSWEMLYAISVNVEH